MVHFGYSTDEGFKVIRLYNEKPSTLRDFIINHRDKLPMSKVIELVEMGNRDYLNEFQPISFSDCDDCDDCDDYEVLMFLDMDGYFKVKSEGRTMFPEEFLSVEESKAIKNRYYSKLRKIESWEDHNSFLLYLQETYEIDLVNIEAEFYSGRFVDGVTLDGYEEISKEVSKPGYSVICRFEVVPVYDDEMEIMNVLIIGSDF